MTNIIQDTKHKQYKYINRNWNATQFRLQTENKQLKHNWKCFNKYNKSWNSDKENLIITTTKDEYVVNIYIKIKRNNNKLMVQS